MAGWDDLEQPSTPPSQPQQPMDADYDDDIPF